MRLDYSPLMVFEVDRILHRTCHLSETRLVDLLAALFWCTRKRSIVQEVLHEEPC
jgi:hypothetical protein